MTDALDKLIEAVEAGTNAPFWDVSDECLDLFTQNQINLTQRANDGSLDAAKALHDALLPGWEWKVSKDEDGGFYALLEQGWSIPHDALDQPNPARAWLLAILRAYKSMQQ